MVASRRLLFTGEGGITPIVVDHSLEGWFMWDRAAIASMLGKRPEDLRYNDPESYQRPAEILAGEFKRSRKDFLKTRCLPYLAERVDYELIASKSSTFRPFFHSLTELNAQRP